jgi:hypothetical protein
MYECTLYNDGIEVGTFDAPLPTVGVYCPVLQGTPIAVYCIDSTALTCKVNIEW